MHKVAQTGQSTERSLGPGRACRLAVGARVAILAFALLCGSGISSGQTYHVVLDYLDETLPYDQVYLTGFEPFSLTGPDSAFDVSGAFAGLSEAQAQQKVSLAVEDAFRALTAGDTDSLAVRFHTNTLPPGVSGRHFRIILGQATSDFLSLLGQARQLSYSNTSSVPDGHYAGVVYTDEIADLPLDYSAVDVAVNAIAGTTAHELGHVFGGWHQDVYPETEAPFPVMAIEATGLETWMRGTARRFSQAENSAIGSSNAELVGENGGLALAPDLQMDGSVDGLDIGLVISNWARTDALHIQGDASGDHVVDGTDAGALVANWTGDPGPADPGTVIAEYNEVTGEIVVSGDGIINWLIESESGGLTGDDPAWGDIGGLKSDQDIKIGSFDLGGMTFTDVNLGAVAAAGVTDLVVNYQSGLGSDWEQGTLVVVPEPMTLSLLGLGGLAAIRRRKS